MEDSDKLEIIVASKDGLILEDSIKSNIDKQQLVNTATLIFGASKKLGELYNKKSNDAIIYYGKLKINLFETDETILLTIINKS